MSTVSKVTIGGIRYCPDVTPNVAVEVMVVPCTNDCDCDSSCFVCGSYLEPLVKCRGVDCCRVACAKCCAIKQGPLNKRFRVRASEPRHWSCPQCDCHKDQDPQSQLNFHFREALRRAGPYDAITMRTIIRRIAASKYDGVLPFFKDLKAFAVDSTGTCTESRLDAVHQVQQYLFEFSAVLNKVEAALEEWDGNVEHQTTHKAATAVLQNATTLTSAVVTSTDNEVEIELASVGNSVAIGPPAIASKPRSLARVNHNQEHYFDSILEGEEIAQTANGGVSSGGINGGKDWRLSKSGHWIRLFAQGPNVLISTKTLESMFENPMRSYVDQVKFAFFLRQYSDIFYQRNGRCEAFAVKSQAVCDFLSV